MKILRRIVPPTEVTGKETGAKTTVHRRIEVTVERESVSILVRGQTVVGTEKTAGEESGPAAPTKKSQPPAKTDRKIRRVR
jgi:hypothetical protein